MIKIFGSKKFIEIAKKTVFLSKDLASLKHNLKGIFQSTKDEMDMHLDTINQNTNEIQSNYEYISEIDAKVEKLVEKIDEIQMQLNPHFYSQDFKNIQLSKREQEFFLGLYTEEDRISVINLSKKTGITLDMCEVFLNRLVVKGIPVVRQLVDGQLFVSIEYTFKDLQARKNILKIDAALFQMIG